MTKSNRIREFRKAKGLNLLDLAGKVGISGAYLSDIERGNRHGSPETISKIAEVLGVTVDKLIRKAG